MSVPLLEVKGLNIGLDHGRQLLYDINFTVSKGETFALLGESGSGKTITALAIARLLSDNLRFISGSINFDGRDLLKLPEIRMREIRGKRVSFIFQEPMTSFNPVQTAGRQIIEVLQCHKGMRKSAAVKVAIDLLEQVGMSDPERVFHAYPHELSGGMKQRAMIALALAGDPDLLIADEPTTALDVTVQAQILNLLKSLQQKLGMTLLFISHDLAIASNIADRVIVMQDGRIVDRTDGAILISRFSHPYSKRLIEVLPTQDKRGKSLLTGESFPFNTTPIQQDQPPALEVNKLEVHYDVRSGLWRRASAVVKAVDQVSFILPKGKTLAVVGESGSGKTTIAKAILGLVKIKSGTVFFDGCDFAQLRRNNLLEFRRQVQIIFQDPFSSMHPKMLVGEAIKEGMRIHKLYRSEQEFNEQTVKLLAEVGLEADVMERYPHEFSGGQKQRLCIARALALKPRVLICDEPTSSLDVSVQAQILDLLQKLQCEWGLSYLFITHDISIVSYMAHEVAVMNAGKIVEIGKTVPLLENPSHQYTQMLLASVPTLQVA